MSATKHSPLPWKVVADLRTSAAYLVYDKDGNFHEDETNEETAAFIENAVNNYDALVEAVKTALVTFGSPSPMWDFARNILKDCGESL